MGFTTTPNHIYTDLFLFNTDAYSPPPFISDERRRGEHRERPFPDHVGVWRERPPTGGPGLRQWLVKWNRLVRDGCMDGLRKRASDIVTVTIQSFLLPVRACLQNRPIVMSGSPSNSQSQPMTESGSPEKSEGFNLPESLAEIHVPLESIKPSKVLS
jgi:hypothetical protein